MEIKKSGGLLICFYVFESVCYTLLKVLIIVIDPYKNIP